MKKLVLIFGMLISLWGNSSQNSQAIAQICADVEAQECIAHFKQICNNGNYDTCGIVAQLYRAVGDYNNAIKYSDIACAKIDENTPATLTTIFGEEVTISAHISKQGKIAECHNLGNAFIEGKHFEVDYSKAIAPFEIACRLGSAPDCNNAAVIYSKGGNGVKKDMKRAKDIFGYACLNTSDISSCHKAKAIKCFFGWCFSDTFKIFD